MGKKGRKKRQRRQSFNPSYIDPSGTAHVEIDPEMFANLFPEMFNQHFQNPDKARLESICEAASEYLRTLLSTVFPTREQFNSNFQGNPSNDSNSKNSNSNQSNQSSTPSSTAATKNKDPFEILELDKTSATPKDVNKAWKKQAMKWHPDKNRDNIDIAEARMKEINAAKNACLGILDGSVDEEGNAKPKNKWETPSDEESDDSDYYNSDEDSTSGSSRKRYQKQRAKQKAFEKKQQKEYNDYCKKQQQDKRKLQREKEKARQRTKLKKKEAKMSVKTRDKKQRQRKGKESFNNTLSLNVNLFVF